MYNIWRVLKPLGLRSAQKTPLCNKVVSPLAPLTKRQLSQASRTAGPQPDLFELLDDSGTVPIKAWTRGVPVEPKAKQQLQNIASLPFLHKHVAVMPDVHLGKGATIGAVLPCVGAVIPAAVGVDIGCGMCAVRTSLTANDLPDNLKGLRSNVEAAIPHGRSGRGKWQRDIGAWKDIPKSVGKLWDARLEKGYKKIVQRHPKLGKANSVRHLGTLGTGNHFIEMCLDENENVWLMLHSGSRGIGNRIGTYFIELAKKDMRKHIHNLPDVDLAYLTEGTEHFDAYVEGVEWAQNYAKVNRESMMFMFLEAVRNTDGIPKDFGAKLEAVDCHHNYISREHHFGKDCIVTRKGAVKAGLGDMGIIPGSMGARSFIVRGKGSKESFTSCSHGAGRIMSRTKAKKTFSVQDHIEATKGVECRKDAAVVDETPMAYKNIDDVMKAQSDLVEIVHTLRQVMCVKG